MAEGAVIVISILLAFGIEAWWTRRGESETAGGYVARLQADLQQDTASLAYLLRGLSRKTVALRSLQASDQDLDVASALLQAEQYGWGQFTFSGTTFEDLRSTGNLRLIRDDRLRAAIVDYYEGWRFEQGRISSRRSNLPALVFKLLPIEFTIADAPGSATVDENQELDLRQSGNADLSSLFEGIETPEFRRELRHEMNYAGFTQTALTRLHRNALSVLRLLESEGP